MDRLIALLALHGVLILSVGMFAGVLAWRAATTDGRFTEWRLVHAGGAGRGVMLMALAAIARLPDMPEWTFALCAWAFILFAWTSLVAMYLRAATGERGFAFSGSLANRTIFGLYMLGGVVVFPAATALAVGLIRAL